MIYNPAGVNTKILKFQQKETRGVESGPAERKDPSGLFSSLWGASNGLPCALLWERREVISPTKGEEHDGVPPCWREKRMLHCVILSAPEPSRGRKLMGSLRATGKSVNSIESLCPPLNPKGEGDIYKFGGKA